MSETCIHCGRTITFEWGYWVDPNARDDDSYWREVCDAHDNFVADHEPTEKCEAGCGYPLTEGRCTNRLCLHYRNED